MPLSNVFEICCLHSESVADLADFLNDLRRNHWSLTSYAYRRKTDQERVILPNDLLEDASRPGRIGTFILRQGDRIISTMQIDDKHLDGRIAVFSEVNTHPDFQKRGTFARTLGEACLRRICQMEFDCIELTTWTFNRKGIPLYKRAGFRAIPGTSLLMRNFLPLILRHPDTKEFFRDNDYIRTLRNQRSYGYDSSAVSGDLVKYCWEAQGVRMNVAVDWAEGTIVSVDKYSTETFYIKQGLEISV
jgi:ribosomal protein S18 acetylase RimI-like enzyme